MRARARMASGIIPAYAGSTAAPVDVERAIRDHPRIRGEHPSMGQHARTCNGSSPHTRGAHQERFQYGEGRRIIPAYAGSTFSFPVPGAFLPDHPRIRGEHKAMHVYPPVSRGSSPHTRGAHLGLDQPPGQAGIIPAYAGSTQRRLAPPRRRSDHPRIRGEHQALERIASAFEGSSPHTRGAHSRSDPLGGTRGIIPAYAGSTRVVTSNRSASSDHPRIRGEHSAGR